MSEKNQLTPAQQELENALSHLQPAAPNLDRDILMYRAGQSSARQPNVTWPAVAALLAVLLGASLLYRSPSQNERIVYVPQPAAPANTFSAITLETERPPRKAQYILLRNKVLAEGVVVLTEMTPATESRTDDSIDQMRQIRSLGSETKRIYDGLL